MDESQAVLRGLQSGGTIDATPNFWKYCVLASQTVCSWVLSQSPRRLETKMKNADSSQTTKELPAPTRLYEVSTPFTSHEHEFLVSTWAWRKPAPHC